MIMLVRDIGGTVVGLGGIAYQVITVPPEKMNAMVMVVLTIVAGIPGASHLLAYYRDGTSTALPSQLSRSQQPPSDSQSQSLNQ
jgi:hypothetical protein